MAAASARRERTCLQFLCSPSLPPASQLAPCLPWVSEQWTPWDAVMQLAHPGGWRVIQSATGYSAAHPAYGTGSYSDLQELLFMSHFASRQCDWKDWCWSWNSNTLGTWCEELTRLRRPWCWERLKAGAEEDDRGWDGWMASPTQWTWIWVDSGSCWWTGRAGMLQSMG